MSDLIQRLRSRPVHVRRRIALMSSGVATGTIALAWFVASLALGSFSMDTTVVAQNSNSTGVVASVNDASSQEAGAAASVQTQPPASEDGITVIDAPKTTAVQVNPSNQTVIPF
jgi:hypothetical protein